MKGLLVGSTLAAWAAGESILKPIDTKDVNFTRYPNVTNRAMYQPKFITVEGPKNTNKFWTHWAVNDPTTNPAEEFPIYCAPWGLKWRVKEGVSKAAGLEISNRQPMYEYGDTYLSRTVTADRSAHYQTPHLPFITLHSKEPMEEHHTVVNESLFGIDVHVQGQTGCSECCTSCSMTYPIYQGMAYVTVRYQGDITPEIDNIIWEGGGWERLKKIRSGVWLATAINYQQMRIYVMNEDFSFVDDSYGWNYQTLNKKLNGWIRVALVNSVGFDEETLDEHAQRIVTGIDVELDNKGMLNFTFATTGNESVPLLHFAYKHHMRYFQSKSDQGNIRVNPRSGVSIPRLSKITPPTKGKMTGVVGEKWTIELDLRKPKTMTWLPEHEGPLPDEKVDIVKIEVRKDFENFKNDANWKKAMFREESYYFGAKGFQKIGMVCLLLEKYYGAGDARTQECAGWLDQGFECLYDHPDTTAAACGTEGNIRQFAGPKALVYDDTWQGIVNIDGLVWNYNGVGLNGKCNEPDFGNACFNDHHYHFGYMVVAAAVLAKLKPAVKQNVAFVDFVHLLIRDTTNPSSDDKFFPRFRGFDWFEFHSWSRGVQPLAEGKDQESASEDINLHYGLILWGRETGNKNIQALGEALMSANAVAIDEYFLVKLGNENHRPEFVRNHGTGIFFQSEVKYTTWFGSNEAFIHGIQMLPLTPALTLIRDKTFCRQEWNDVLTKLPETKDPKSAWGSILLTGSQAMFSPETAWSRALQQEVIDDGLTNSYMYYWVATKGKQLERDETPGSLPWEWFAVGGVAIVLLVVLLVMFAGPADRLESPAQELNPFPDASV